jgi:hypothetical protein
VPNAHLSVCVCIETSTTVVAGPCEINGTSSSVCTARQQHAMSSCGYDAYGFAVQCSSQVNYVQDAQYALMMRYCTITTLRALATQQYWQESFKTAHYLLVFVPADLMQSIEPCLGVLNLHSISEFEIRLVYSQS